MSLVGLRPVVEIMFADFLPTAGDAIVNQLPKYRFMSGGQCVRAGDDPGRSAARPVGSGRSTRATFESWFMHLPGLRVVTAVVARGRLRPAPRRDRATTTRSSSSSTRRCTGARARCDRGEVAELGKAAVVRDGQRRHDRRDAADGRARRSPRPRRSPRRASTPRSSTFAGCARSTCRPSGASVERTGRLVVAEEQVHAAGWGATIISELTIGGHVVGDAAAPGQPAGRLPDPVHPAARGPGRAIRRRDRRRRPGRRRPVTGRGRPTDRRAASLPDSGPAPSSSSGSRPSRCARRSTAGSRAAPTAWTTAARS